MKNGKTNGHGKRRSRAEAMTGKKAASSSMRKVSAQSEMKLPSPETWELHFKSIRGAMDRRDSASAFVTSCKKAANAVHPDLGKTVERLVKLEKAGDVETLMRELKMLGFGLKQVQAPIQLSIHNTLFGDPLAQAAREGRDDSANGRMAHNPYPEGSALATAYAGAYAKDQARILKVPPARGEDKALAHAAMM
jgi:hypothetical protein